MGIEYENDKFDELLRLTKENNKMLHAMRRSAFFGGIFKLLMWAVFIIVPIWLYMQYLAPVMQSMLESYQQIQGTSAKAQAQFGELNTYLQKFQQMTGGEKSAQ
ncbi:MAG: hypothetical protein AAB908_01180 [Patescibacteria group bacterium]